jgi:hypothetical protein
MCTYPSSGMPESEKHACAPCPPFPMGDICDGVASGQHVPRALHGFATTCGAWFAYPAAGTLGSGQVHASPALSGVDLLR